NPRVSIPKTASISQTGATPKQQPGLVSPITTNLSAVPSKPSTPSPSTKIPSPPSEIPQKNSPTTTPPTPRSPAPAPTPPTPFSKFSLSLTTGYATKSAPPPRAASVKKQAKAGEAHRSP